ncbi:MAG: hypothetical protein AAF502_14495 [Bacteroidota bacterium]
MIRIWLCLGLCLMGFLCSAQNFEADLEKMQNAYVSISDFHFKMKIRHFTSPQSNSPVATETMEACKSGEQVIFRTDDYQILVNNECMISLAKANKVMVYAPFGEYNEEPESLDTEQIMPEVDSLLQQFESIIFKGITSGLKHYRLTSPNAMIMQMDLFIDPTEFLIRKTVLLYHPRLFPDNQKVEIDYILTDVNPDFPTGYFAETQFVDRQDDELVPSKGYQAYTLVVNTPFEFEPETGQ